MSPTDLHISLLRPPILQILRAAGFQAARSAAVDTLVDLADRYLSLLATQTAAYAWSNHGDPEPDLQDALMALESVGALRPQRSAMEDQFFDDDDLRGLEAFLSWLRGEGNTEIMRIAGLLPPRNESGILGERGEDYLTLLKKKHSKTGEESRFQGTALGKSAPDKAMSIDGNDITSIRAWEDKLRQTTRTAASTPLSQTMSPPSVMSSPLSEI